MAKFIEEDFGGAKRKFRLGLGELRELQDSSDVGPATLIARLISLPAGVDRARQPRSEDYAGGINDPDYESDQNIYMMLRTFGGDWRVDDLRNTIRLGLIGAGATPTDADVLMLRHFDRTEVTGLHEHVGLAAKILIHAIAPEKDDPAGKAEAETTPTVTS